MQKVKATNIEEKRITNWILTRTQVAQSLASAWETFYSQLSKEDPEYQLKKLEIEKKISSILEETWNEKIQEERTTAVSSQKAQPLSLSGDCISYNIHQEDDKEQNIDRLTVWRLTLQNLKVSTTEKTQSGSVQLQALELPQPDKGKEKKMDKIKKKIAK